jgi:hypothetical protein
VWRGGEMTDTELVLIYTAVVLVFFGIPSWLYSIGVISIYWPVGILVAAVVAVMTFMVMEN